MVNDIFNLSSNEKLLVSWNYFVSIFNCVNISKDDLVKIIIINNNYNINKILPFNYKKNYFYLNKIL